MFQKKTTGIPRMNNSFVFLNKTQQQTMSLLKFSRDYIKWQAPFDVEKMSPALRFKVTCEAMRVSVRLNQITVWFLIQKEIQEHKLISTKKDIHTCKVLQGKAYLDKTSEMDPELPLRLREILQLSRILYFRVLRVHEASLRQPFSPHEIRKAKKISVV
jgi:hypothetical protein